VTQPAAARSDRYGNRWYTVPDENGELHDLVSVTRLKDLLHSGGLETWKLKTVARNMALRPDLQMLAGNDETLYKAAMEAARDERKANAGTAVHKLVELVEAGTLDMDFVPEASRPYVEQYVAARQRWGLRVVDQEFTVYNLTVGYAGTADMLAGFGDRPDLFIMDVKTGADVWPETAKQLAAYANAEGIWVPPSDEFPEVVEARAELERNIAAKTNIPPGRRKWSVDAIKVAEAEIDALHWRLLAQYPGRRPMPENLRRDVGYVIHLRPDSCELFELRLDGDQVSAFDTVCGLAFEHRWQQRKDIVSKVEVGPLDVEFASGEDPVVEPPEQPAADLTEDDPDDLAEPDESEAVEPIEDDDEATAPVNTEAVEASPTLPEGAATADKLTDPMPEGHRARTVDEMLDGELRAWLVERLVHFPKPSVELLLERWPSGVPTFKRSDAHTRAQLDEIREILDGVEAEHHLEGIDPWPYIDKRITVPATEDQAVADLAAAGLTGTVTDGDDAPGNKQPVIDRLQQFANRQPGQLPLLREHLARAGLTKKLQGQDVWTVAELRRFTECLDLVDDSLDPF